MFVLSETEVRQAMSLKDCLEVNRRALMSISDQTAFVPPRLGLPYPHNPLKQPPSSETAASAKDWTLVKPAAFYGTGSSQSTSPSVSMGLKVVSVRAQNPAQGFPLVPATILVLNPKTGIVYATIAGTHVTVVRTSAGPALAVQALRPNLQDLVVFGAGAQAECHIELIQIAVGRTIPKITIINRTKERGETLRTKLLHTKESDQPQEIRVVTLDDDEGVAEAVSKADVICTTTNATEPLWKDGSILKPGCLITGIGSYTPQMQEVPPSAVDRCHVVIDTPEAITVGDLKHLQGEASQVQSGSPTTLGSSGVPVSLAGDAFRDPSSIGTTTDCIFYKAVGTAIQDVLTAEMVIGRAKELGIGQEIDMT